jgi:hypothetical protein
MDEVGAEGAVDSRVVLSAGREKAAGDLMNRGFS